MLLALAHGDDVVEADLQGIVFRSEADELRAAGGVDVVDHAALALGHAFEIELQFHTLLVHGRRFQLVVVIAGDRAVRFGIHRRLLSPSSSRSVPWYDSERVRLK